MPDEINTAVPNTLYADASMRLSGPMRPDRSAISEAVGEAAHDMAQLASGSYARLSKFMGDTATTVSVGTKAAVASARTKAETVPSAFGRLKGHYATMAKAARNGIKDAITYSTTHTPSGPRQSFLDRVTGRNPYAAYGILGEVKAIGAFGRARLHEDATLRGERPPTQGERFAAFAATEQRLHFERTNPAAAPAAAAVEKASLTRNAARLASEIRGSVHAMSATLLMGVKLKLAELAADAKKLGKFFEEGSQTVSFGIYRGMEYAGGKSRYLHAGLAVLAVGGLAMMAGHEVIASAAVMTPDTAAKTAHSAMTIRTNLGISGSPVVAATTMNLGMDKAAQAWHAFVTQTAAYIGHTDAGAKLVTAAHGNPHHLVHNVPIAPASDRSSDLLNGVMQDSLKAHVPFPVAASHTESMKMFATAGGHPHAVGSMTAEQARFHALSITDRLNDTFGRLAHARDAGDFGPSYALASATRDTLGTAGSDPALAETLLRHHMSAAAGAHDMIGAGGGMVTEMRGTGSNLVHLSFPQGTGTVYRDGLTILREDFGADVGPERTLGM